MSREGGDQAADTAEMLRSGQFVKPEAQLAAGKSFFAQMGLDVRHFGAIWHIFKIGQLMATDLNAVSRRHGLSIADFHLLSALMMSGPEHMRPTDLAHALNVTNAALSTRIRRLSACGFIAHLPVPSDARSRRLQLTESGQDKVRAIGEALEVHCRFVHHYHQLPEEERLGLDRVVAALHTALARDFVAAPRTDS